MKTRCALLNLFAAPLFIALFMSFMPLAGVLAAETDKTAILALEDAALSDCAADFKFELENVVYEPLLKLPENIAAPQEAENAVEELAMLLDEPAPAPRVCRFKRDGNSLALNGGSDCL